MADGSHMHPASERDRDVTGRLLRLRATQDQPDAHGNPLRLIEDALDFNVFRQTLLKVRDKHRKSNAGRKPYDVVLMFKMLVLQSLNNLTDGQLEYQVRDRPRRCVVHGVFGFAAGR
jgi:Transposase domain (DUF772)